VNTLLRATHAHTVQPRVAEVVSHAASHVFETRRYFQTLANLIGFIKSQGGHVVGATALTGKPYSAKLAPEDAQIQALRDKHGQEFEDWWRQRFGFGFAELTR
jgi:hypothetical protein